MIVLNLLLTKENLKIKLLHKRFAKAFGFEEKA